MELWGCLKNDRRLWNEMVNMLFNKILHENKKCIFYFLLKKLKEILGQPQTNSSENLRQTGEPGFTNWEE